MTSRLILTKQDAISSTKGICTSESKLGALVDECAPNINDDLENTFTHAPSTTGGHPDKVRVEAQQSRHIDFLANAPYELITKILGHIPQENLAEVAVAVSWTWRRRILGCQECWRIIDDCTDKPWLYILLPLISRHVESLILPHEPQLTKCLDLVTTGSFSNLRSLTLEADDDETSHYQSIPSILSSIASHLTSLELGLPGEETPSLYTVLKICRNLTSIRFCAYSNPQAFIGSGLPHTTSLETVILLSPIQSLSASDIRWFLQSSPQILRLDISGWTCDIFDEINQCLPNIRALCFNGYSDVKYLERRYPATSPGLRNLNVMLPTWGSNPFSSIFESHRQTLQELNIIFDMFDETTRSWGPLLASTLPSLRKLCFSYTPASITSELAAILQKCPNLETFHLKDPVNALPDNMFAAAAKLRRLSTFWLDGAQRDCMYSGRAMLQFLEAQVQQRNKIQGLVSLTLDCCTPLTYQIAIMSTGIKTLENLTIKKSAGGTDFISTQEQDKIMNAVSQMPNLKSSNFMDSII